MLFYIQLFECEGNTAAAHYNDAAGCFKALAHPVRLQILDMLRNGEVCVCHMEAALGKRQAYISQQLMVLRDAGLVESRKEGLSVFCRIVDEAVLELLQATLGQANEDMPTVLKDCPCLHCAEVTSNVVS